MNLSKADKKNYQVVWTFLVQADSQEEANAHIKQRMDAFAESQGWGMPKGLEKAK
jgi:hypothetical protein